MATPETYGTGTQSTDGADVPVDPVRIQLAEAPPTGPGDFPLDTYSFRPAAVLTALLYVTFLLPGIVSNIYFLRRAGAMRKREGEAP